MNTTYSVYIEFYPYMQYNCIENKYEGRTIAMDIKEIAFQLTIKALEKGYIADYGTPEKNAENISKFYLDTYNTIKVTDEVADKDK